MARSLKQVKRRDPLLDLGNELDGGGAGADHGHVPAAQIEGVVPLRGVERAPLELREPRQVGRDRIAQRTARQDKHVGGERSGRRVDVPACRPIVPLRRLHLVLEADVREDAELARAALQVPPDLGLA